MTNDQIQAGIEITRERGASRAEYSQRWLMRLIDRHDVLPLDAVALCAWAKLMHRGGFKRIRHDATGGPRAPG